MKNPMEEQSPDDPEYYLKLASELRRQGFDGIMSFAEAYPKENLRELATRLGVTPILIHWKFIDEAIQRDQAYRYSKVLLVRLLWCAPLGWIANTADQGHKELLFYLVSWESDLHELHQDRVARNIIIDLLNSQSIPEGWQPSGVDDPRLDAVFRKHWPSLDAA